MTEPHTGSIIDMDSDYLPDYLEVDQGVDDGGKQLDDLRPAKRLRSPNKLWKQLRTFNDAAQSREYIAEQPNMIIFNTHAPVDGTKQYLR